MSKQGYVYIMASGKRGEGRTLYTGVTADLDGRVSEHKLGIGSQFAAKYRCHRLVYYEHFFDIAQAIDQEKQIKSRSRKYKIGLIEAVNPDWLDISDVEADLPLDPDDR